MRWRFNFCRKQRENASLLASGLLPEADAASLREHLAACTGCREYHDEIVLLSGQFREWSATQARVEVPPSLHARWRRSIDTASIPPGSWAERLGFLWPSPAAWGALAVVWIGLAILQSTTPDTDLTQATTASQGKPFTLAQRQRELSSLLESMSQPLSSTAAPELPGPRSDRRDRSATI